MILLLNYYRDIELLGEHMWVWQMGGAACWQGRREERCNETCLSSAEDQSDEREVERSPCRETGYGMVCETVGSPTPLFSPPDHPTSHTAAPG